MSGDEGGILSNEDTDKGDVDADDNEDGSPVEVICLRMHITTIFLRSLYN